MERVNRTRVLLEAGACVRAQRPSQHQAAEDDLVRSDFLGVMDALALPDTFERVIDVAADDALVAACFQTKALLLDRLALLRVLADHGADPFEEPMGPSAVARLHLERWPSAQRPLGDALVAEWDQQRLNARVGPTAVTRTPGPRL